MELIILILCFPLIVLSTIWRFKMRRNMYSHLNSLFFNVNEHSAAQNSFVPIKNGKPTPKSLEEYYSFYRKFHVGQFRAGIERKMNTKGTGDVSLAELAVLTFFYIRIPDSTELNFSIDIPVANFPKAISADSPEEFVSLIEWNIPNEELEERFGHKDFIIMLRRLFSGVGPCDIRCETSRFVICTKKPIRRIDQLKELRDISPEIFRIFAQVAQLRLISWRNTSKNYDWWSAKPDEN